jgi:hypothetical protein
VVERGAGEIFRSLFSRPFGPLALEAFVAGGGLQRMVELPPDPEPRDEGLALGGRPLRLSVRAGAAIPGLRVSGSSVESPALATARDLALAVAVPLRSALGLELEVGWITTEGSEPFRSTAFWDAFLGRGYLGDREPPPVDVALDVVPFTAKFELGGRLGRRMAFGLTAGGGAAWERLEFRPDASYGEAQHAQGWSPAVQAGLAASADLGRGLTAGLRAEVLALVSPLRTFETDFAFHAIRLAFTASWAPAGPRGIR